MEVVLRRDGGVAAALSAAHDVQRADCRRIWRSTQLHPSAVSTVPAGVQMQDTQGGTCARAIVDELRVQLAGQRHIGEGPGRDKDELSCMLPGGLQQLDDAEP